ncbi:uncharacterized protein ASCRUDRAFT_79223 [Ascoidea rubescens DSM 1968]|uniref:Uncharacterized protein n=1 Tax=Ascoidea rubescens DSM 1968 TaxID=1344418 RepID=A0A1D2VRY0_9ASCO|nr:hypothetical protein ASCRUDRAFT_79223 [Ascoidea rubescens DSM 1968]ODV64361.1 hypothetical protein ASCRUDRAFT_79223 [Ascoidea rubescens DSM 1968]
MNPDERPHPLLSQVPLVISPFYNPPKTVSLPYNYKSLPSQLPPSLLSSFDSTQGHIQALTNDASLLSSQMDQVLLHSHRNDYQAWLRHSTNQLAPGYFDTNLLLAMKKLSK